MAGIPGPAVGGQADPYRFAKLPGVGLRSWYAAVKYLKSNPQYAAQHAWYLSKKHKGLLNDAGYQIGKGNEKGRTALQKIAHGPKGLTYYKNVAWLNAKGIDLADLKPKPDPKTKPPKPSPAPPGDAGATVSAGQVDPVLAALANSYPGLDLTALQNVRIPKIGGIDPNLAKGGAQPMTRADVDKLVGTIINPKRTKTLYEQDRIATEKQTEHNLGQLDNWYGQVLDSQGVAAQRSEGFGKAAVDANAGATAAIVSSLGGEANQGSYVVGAAGAENAGLLNALGSIENQYNADIRPLLQAEAAGQKAREQAAGTARLRDLSRSLAETESQGSADEAKLRYDIWQNNQQILNDRIARRIGIIQANQGLRQQDYQNQLGLAQAGLAAQASAAGLGLDATGKAISYLDDQRDAEAAAARDAAKKAPPPFAKATQAQEDRAYNTVLGLIEGRNLSPQQAMAVAANAIRSQFKWNPKNPGPAALIRDALREAGYDV